MQVAKRVSIDRRRSAGGELQNRVVDFVIQPLKDDGDVVIGLLVDAKEVADDVGTERGTGAGDDGRRFVFECAGVSLWEEDCTEVVAWLERLRAAGVRDLRAHLDRHPELVREAVDLVRVVDVNQEALRAFGARTKDALKASLARTFTADSLDVFKEELVALAEGQTSYSREAVLCTVAGEPRHVQLTARLRAERVGDEAIVAVRDSGVGVPKPMQGRVFELFTRLNPSDTINANGLGIGLALSKRLVELHGGRIELRSEGPNLGSEFRVYLPISERTEASVPRRSEFEQDAGPSRSVLVVDDNQDAAESLAMLLQLSGCSVKTAFNGPQALDVLEAFNPGVVLLDIGMPGMDGYEVARRIRATPRGREIRLIALTGWGQAEDKRRAFEAGFDLHLTKPVDPATLLSGSSG